MGLAAPRTKQRFGLDPRNTNWSNNQSRFGHQHLTKLGWKPGNGLGLVDNGLTTHIKVVLKADNTGLGANLAKKRAKKDEFDSGECTGLDVFQRLLGRLNGKEEQINDELDRKRQERIISGKWGIAFVKGDTLSSTWDKENKKFTESQAESQTETKTSDKKRKIDDIKDDQEIEVVKKHKKSKKEKKSKKDSKEKKHKKSKESSSDSSIKKHKSKKDKKDKKEKQDKKDKKDKKHKKSHKHKNSSDSDEVTRESMLKPKESRESTATVPTGRMALRSKWIKQKRAAVMDEKALQEIFMVT